VGFFSALSSKAEPITNRLAVDHDKPRSHAKGYYGDGFRCVFVGSS
jgi:hypothetical protein